MSEMDYIKRIIDDDIELKLQVTGGVVIRGPKWCGKTTSAEQFAKSVLKLQDPKTIEKNKQIAQNDISLLLEGEKPRLIDEWQAIPNIWNAVRTDIDEKDDAAEHQRGIDQQQAQEQDHEVARAELPGSEIFLQ